jgi:hypothetical protein
VAKYKLVLHGCDDSTAILVELSPSEAVLLTELEEKFHQASSYGCEPTMSVIPME